MKSIAASSTNIEINTPRLRGALPTLLTLVALVAAVFVLFKTVPIGDWMNAATGWVESLGVWAPIAFIAIYITTIAKRALNRHINN
jgi:hypothetical protein